LDYDTPIQETLEALHDVVKAGKARYIGASSMHAWQFARALGIAGHADKKVINRVAQIAASRGIARAQVALAWLLTKPVITAPIVGATKL
jgi:aryl-alcohol dehydrogenase-like predicted oxidoreductase